MKKHARAVIVGGGILGCSTAYHLAKMGWSDVVLIEKGELTSGSTWHSAGLVGQLRSSRNVTRMLEYSAELYGKLEEETGQSTGFARVGGLRLACTPPRMEELRRAATMAKTFGLEMHLLSPAEAGKLFPPMSIEGVLGAAILPSDGHIDPAGVTMALAKGARAGGVEILRNTRLTGMSARPQGGFSLTTSAGDMECEIFVNCSGLWAAELGRMVGVRIPMQPMQHQYIVTKARTPLPKDLPTLRDPDHLVYYKAETGGLAMGGYEHNPIPWALGGIPDGFGQQLLSPDYDHFEPMLKLAFQRTPELEEAEILKLINGPEGFTPDGNPVMGEAPEVRNYFVAAGFNAFGIAAGGGAGRALAEWIAEGGPSLDLWELDILRFGESHYSPDYVRLRTCEGYARHYAIAYPGEEYESCRPLRTSPLYGELAEQGAVFGAKFGWERPNWFAVVEEGNQVGTPARDEPTFGRPNWFAAVGEEHRAVRERAGIIDQSSFAKFEVSGPGALDFLQRIACNEMDKLPGTITYTQMLTEEGGIACDLTVTRLAEQRFYITTGTGFATHDAHWMRRSLPGGDSVSIQEVTSARACLNLCGPEARNILAGLTDDDVSNEGFPYLTAREIRLGQAPVLALRVTYVGELGWELHVPTEYALYLYRLIREAGQPAGLVNAGYRAIESLRLEKGYRYWSADVTPDYNPYEAGLGFCVKLDKGDFIGREALLRQREAGLTRRLRTVTVATENVAGNATGNIIASGKEAVLDGERVIGSVTSSGYGYTVGKTILLAYLPMEFAALGTTVTVEIGGERFPGQVAPTALYDPRNERVKV